MPTETLLLASTMVLGLVLYFLFGGADFGGGVWDLLARGPRKPAQRAQVGDAIGPVWEANHVWLIFAVVLLFSGFQKAFAAISIALHVPLTLFLVGVVMRGSAFVFRSANYDNDVQQRRWGRVFGWASLVSPFLLGMSVGAIASGEIRVENGTVSSGFFAPWLTPFSWIVGAFALALCAFLAAVYLAYEAKEPELKEDFRKRALTSGIIVGVLAFAALIIARWYAPVVFDGLLRRPWTWAFHGATALAAIGALIALYQRRYGAARILAGAQVTLVLFGWAISQYPYLIVPDVTLTDAASNLKTQRAVLWAVLAGAPVLIPSLWILFKVFKTPAKESA